MLPFKMLTYNGSQEPSPKTFFILMKGKNAGKPSRQPFRNSLAIICETEEQAANAFAGASAIHHAKVFPYYLVGSVIPFLRVSEVRMVYSVYEHLFSQPPTTHHRQLSGYLTLADNLANQRETLLKLISGFALAIVKNKL